jgi:hypothetical protein
VTKIRSVRQAHLKSLRSGLQSRRKPRSHRRTDKPLTAEASQFGTPRFGLVHALRAKPLTTKPPDIGREPPPPPGVHNLKAGPSKRSRKRSSPTIQRIQTVLRDQIPEWRERFPTPEEMPNKKLQQIGRAALRRDPRTADWEWEKTRKSFMRAVGREKLK